MGFVTIDSLAIAFGCESDTGFANNRFAIVTILITPHAVNLQKSVSGRRDVDSPDEATHELVSADNGHYTQWLDAVICGMECDVVRIVTIVAEYGIWDEICI